MKTVLITGGTGFIGSHFAKFLLEKGYRVIAVDNFLTSNESNIKDIKENPNFKLINHDISLPLEIDEDVHYLLHFASPASPVDYSQLPIQTLKVGALGTHNALGIARAKNAVFMLASTSEVYGDPLVHPQPESYWGNVNPTGPRGVYDEAKRFAEAMTIAYHKIHKIDIKIARIFNTFGPKMRKKDGRAVPNFITQALANQPVTVYGDGSQTRSFCYISDLIEGLYKLMLSDVNEPVNIGNPNEYTILDLAKKIIQLSGSTSEIVFKDLPVDDPKTRCPNITKAKTILEWQPTIGVDEGLTKTIEWFRTS
ncbi:NAD-dependent dehydratase [Candidatus Woesearchaeota archaeon]|nr:NAD-dependent dehydratase [Candidatus Woesearchaeota archaeon]|tara:strand:+ start:10365 stop:11294 length:930 start_codon:yes stop_codon:yes gene_type:complete